MMGAAYNISSNLPAASRPTSGLIAITEFSIRKLFLNADSTINVDPWNGTCDCGFTLIACQNRNQGPELRPGTQA
ncbi:hypothetical protein [Aurantiacibacter rhizosphaerae]|uniref:Uncharacterized protein n=1 Tax=Aurantiacibacter rhizosphaerae TaxID=2691582 RepID=A0A844X9H9_9SPHN|nr:hypothetical protein [Aurantiacibacter rhizosphaerae]MWV26997.1 hypothetical protein [Aurantiacibacter rhizosphaerae]